MLVTQVPPIQCPGTVAGFCPVGPDGCQEQHFRILAAAGGREGSDVLNIHCRKVRFSPAKQQPSAQWRLCAFNPRHAAGGGILVLLSGTLSLPMARHDEGRLRLSWPRPPPGASATSCVAAIPKCAGQW